MEMNRHYFESPEYSLDDLIRDDIAKHFVPEQDSLTKVIGTGADTIKIVKNFMPEKDVEIIMGKMNFMYGQGERRTFNPNVVDSKVLEYVKKVKEKSESLFNVDMDYDEYASPSTNFDSYLAGRMPNFVTAVHSDNLDIDKGKYQEYNWSGHVSNLIYLNDDYVGGELFFPYHNLKIKPEMGMLISFPGHWWNRHGILPASSMRFAMSVFFKIKNFE